VVLFTVNEDELAERMLSRGRDDDTEETIRTRFRTYNEQTEPLIALYRQRDVVVEVDGMGEIDEITERVLAAVRDGQPG
jgi:adenylate kinase